MDAMKGYRIKRTSLTLMSIMGISLLERKSSLQPGGRNYRFFCFWYGCCHSVLYFCILSIIAQCKQDMMYLVLSLNCDYLTYTNFIYKTSVTGGIDIEMMTILHDQQELYTVLYLGFYWYTNLSSFKFVMINIGLLVLKCQGVVNSFIFMLFGRG